MYRFGQNAAGIQAIASVASALIAFVLVVVTWRYVSLTNKIAESSAAQVKEMREAAAEAQTRNTRALADLARRMRNSLAVLDADAPRENQVRHFEQVKESDIARLEVLAPQIDNAEISGSASDAVASIRDILAIVNLFKAVNPGAGVAFPNEQGLRWQRAREGSDRSLHMIEDECRRLLGDEH